MAASARAASLVDGTTLDQKLMLGYQGWFACPGDGSPLAAWEHWFRRGDQAAPETLRVDMWPDVSELEADERCDTPLTLASGARAQLYSAYNPKTVDRHFRWMQEYDLAGIDYMPVVFPGFSWHNMNPAAPFNPIPRRGGRFYWRQVGRALQAGNTMLYGAMFDEVDEGTAMFKVAATRSDAPEEVPLVTLDVDGERLPSDWYLRLASEAQKALRKRP